MTEFAPGREAEFDSALALRYTREYIEGSWGLDRTFSGTLVKYVDLCAGYDELGLADSFVDGVKEPNVKAELYAVLAYRTRDPKYIDSFGAAWAEYYITTDDQHIDFTNAIKPFEKVLELAEDKSLLVDIGRSASNPYVRTTLLAIIARKTGSVADLKTAIELCLTLPDSLEHEPYISDIGPGYRKGTIVMSSIWTEIKTSATEFGDEATRDMAQAQIDAIWDHEDGYRKAASDGSDDYEEDPSIREAIDKTQEVVKLMYTRPIDEARQAIDDVNDILLQAQLWEVIFENTDDVEDFRQVLNCSLRGTTKEDSIKYSVIGARLGLFDEIDALPFRNDAVVEAHRALTQDDEGKKFDCLLKSLQFARDSETPVQELVTISDITGFEEYIAEAHQQVLGILKQKFISPEPVDYDERGQPIYSINMNDDWDLSKGIESLVARYIRRGQTKALDSLNGELDSVTVGGSQYELRRGFLNGLFKGMPNRHPPEKKRYHSFLSASRMIFIASIPES